MVDIYLPYIANTNFYQSLHCLPLWYVPVPQWLVMKRLIKADVSNVTRRPNVLQKGRSDSVLPLEAWPVRSNCKCR